MLWICGFVPQKVSVRACFKKFFKALFSAFTEGECYRAVGVIFLYLADDFAHPLVGVVRVLAALQNKGSEPERVARFAAVQNLFLAQAVTHGVFV